MIRVPSCTKQPRLSQGAWIFWIFCCHKLSFESEGFWEARRSHESRTRDRVPPIVSQCALPVSWRWHWHILALVEVAFDLHCILNIHHDSRHLQTPSFPSDFLDHWCWFWCVRAGQAACAARSGGAQTVNIIWEHMLGMLGSPLVLPSHLQSKSYLSSSWCKHL
jgi:hypothetical protein